MEDSIFTKLFGNKVVVKLIDFFLENPKESFTKKEVQEMAGLSKASLFEHWPKLEKFEIISVERDLGNTKLFKLNKQNLAVKSLINLDKQLTLAGFPKVQVEKRKVLA